MCWYNWHLLMGLSHSRIGARIIWFTLSARTLNGTRFVRVRARSRERWHQWVSYWIINNNYMHSESIASDEPEMTEDLNDSLSLCQNPLAKRYHTGSELHTKIRYTTLCPRLSWETKVCLIWWFELWKPSFRVLGRKNGFSVPIVGGNGFDL